MLSYGELAQAPLSDYQKSLRERAHGSLDNLTQAFRLPHPDRSPKRSPGHSVNFQGHSELRSHNSIDYGSAAHRLKFLLKEEERKLHPNTDYKLASFPGSTSIRNQPLQMRDLSSPSISHHDMRNPDTLPTSDQLVPLIKNQSSYIQQLEGDLKFCKEEMLVLKDKTDNVLSENVKLHEELKTNMVQLALELQQFPQEAEDKLFKGSKPDANKIDPEQPMNKDLYAKWEQELEQVKQFHEAKTKRLESQLTYTKNELKKHEELCDDLRSKLRMSESLSLLGKDDTPKNEGMCIRCAQHEAVLASTHMDNKSKILDSLTRERDDLMDVVTTMKSNMVEMKQKEAEAYTQVKHSLDMLQEAQLEKTQALVQREQLADDVRNSEQRMTDLVADQQNRLMTERELVRREYEQQLEQLQQQIAQGVQENAAIQNQIEKVTREKVALTNELEQAKSQIMQHSVYITQASHDAKVSSTSSTIQRDEAIRQLDKLRQTTSLEIQELVQEKTRLKSELGDVKRRMDEAEKQALLSKDESIKLTERCNTAERDLMLVKMAKDGIDRSRNDELRTLTRRTQQREQELQQVIHEQENRYSSTVTELENVICSQGLLINKLRDEGTNLTDKVQEVSDKYRSEIRRLKQTNSELSLRCDRLSQQHAEMEMQCVDHGRLHKRMKSRLEQLDEHGQRTGKQIYELLQKQTGLMKERHALSQEVEFLRSQIQKASPQSISSITRNLSKENIGGSAISDLMESNHSAAMTDDL
ncbi:serologically defined colon cancer antigen 8 homolog [Antedon mediterranea]|uniref:serologically defined colon cancer antigen 8 homolog n=1 Tax=Antedon mediterranea TaxID=105859 RepID=UPI003AF6EAA5